MAEEKQTVEEFLAQGGQIRQVQPGESGQLDARKAWNPGPPLIFDKHRRQAERSHSTASGNEW